MALLSLGLVAPAWSRPPVAPAPGPEEPGTLCAVAGTLRGADGRHATVSLCADGGHPRLTVSAAAVCGRNGSPAGHGCRTTGTWTARHAGTTLAGRLPGAAEYPGPGTYDLTATVRVRSTPGGVDLQGTVHTTLTLTTPQAKPTHAITVDRSTLRRGATTTLTYTIRRDSDEGDGSARFGLIGEEESGVRLATDDARCVNPLVGRSPARTRLRHALDCALTTLQPGNPEQVTVRVTVGSTCSTVVSKLGYWMPDGQTLYTGGMLPGPKLTCG
ncbi:hypothetical protein [Streptomyces sp. NRRL F-5727]|uniref:hypothetical protein n=1 Tax=Streptomyces sp. NRRL F-5727 TaxID=1463871 RepID=UPI001F468F63|nr:hypothetical protein [Streptomyces sp. NRRL F-5727]